MRSGVGAAHFGPLGGADGPGPPGDEREEEQDDDDEDDFSAGGKRPPVEARVPERRGKGAENEGGAKDKASERPSPTRTAVARMAMPANR
jgi:hypothetical protein